MIHPNKLYCIQLYQTIHSYNRRSRESSALNLKYIQKGTYFKKKQKMQYITTKTLLLTEQVLMLQLKEKHAESSKKLKFI